MYSETPSEKFSADTIAIIGVGLLGGSIAAAVRTRHLVNRVIGVGRSLARLEIAESAGLIDSCTTDVTRAAQDAEMLVFCTPVDQIVRGVRTAVANGRPGTLITDVGSIKGSICRGVSDGLTAGATFIGSHPLAGSEKQGFKNSDADLFDGCVCVVTPDNQTPLDQLARLTRFWRALGAVVIEMSPEDHDHTLAKTSHLPHVVAATLASMLTETERDFAASGFRDTTRIGAADPELWIGILRNNVEAVIESLDSYSDRLGEFRAALANHDANALKSLLQLAKTNRDALD